MTYARILFSQGSATSLELGLDSIDDPAVLEPLVRNAYALWQLATEDAEDDGGG